MADKALSDLPSVSTMSATDMFLMQQESTGEAKKVTGSVIQDFAETKAAEFIEEHTEDFYQGPRGWGLEDIELVSGTHASGTFDTYRGVYKDVETHVTKGYTSNYQVYNGADGLNRPPAYDTDITIAVSDWSADSTYEDFGYKALVPLFGVDSTDIPNIVLSPEDALSGNFAPVCATYSSGGSTGIIIYAAEIPDDSITILTAYAIHTQN